MIYKDFRNTYKSFLLLLCGMLLALTAGAEFGLALGIGLLLYFVFLTRFLDALLCDAIFDSEGNIADPEIPWKRLMYNKLVVLLSYSAIGEAVFLVISMVADSESKVVFSGAVIYQIAAGIIPGLSFLAIMLVCSFLSLKNPRRTTWYIFWILNFFIVPFVVCLCLDLGLSSIASGVSAEAAAALLQGVIYLFIIFVALKKYVRK